MNEPNPPYEAELIAGMPLVGIVPGKFYLMSVHGRPDRAQVWGHGDLNPFAVKSGIERVLASDSDCAGIPHIVIALPHVTRVYSFGSPFEPLQRETNVHGSLYNSRTLESKTTTVVGCDGELLVLGKERNYWNEATTVDEYLKRFVANGLLGRVANPNKLRQWLEKR